MKLGFIIGNLTKNPELRTLQDGTVVGNFTVAVNEKGKRAENQPPEFYRVETWRGLAETCAQSLFKGSKVGIVGKMKTVSFDGQSGPVKMQVITASEVEFLSPKQAQNGQYPQQPYQAPNAGYQQQGQYPQIYPPQSGQYAQPPMQPPYQQPPAPPQQQYPPTQAQPQQQYQQQPQAAPPIPPTPDPLTADYGAFPPLDDAELPF